MATEQKKSSSHGRRGVWFTCAPKEEGCPGKTADDKTGPRVGMHQSEGEVLRCRTRWLLKNGWTRISAREFSPPGGGPILVLSKHPARACRGKPDKSAFLAKGIIEGTMGKQRTET